VAVTGAAARVGTDQRRARLALRHHLAAEARAGSVEEVARDLVALHSTDAASVYLGAWARMCEVNVGMVEKMRRDGEIAYRLLEDVGADAAAAVHGAAARLGAWLGDTRVTPRFRTPLERELSAPDHLPR
jgi:hypothetical protein